MTGVSIVVPALADTELLAEALPPLARELERRRAGDELLLVDDTGEGRLAAFARAGFPWVRTLASPANEGFARALSRGIEAARHPLVLALNSDVRVRPGFLEPLEQALAEPDVFAAVPRILLGGEASAVESLVSVRLEGSVARAAQPAVEEPSAALDEARLSATLPVPFPIGGACLLRRELFLELGGFDPAFEPFYLEDLDLGWRAWKAGYRCVYAGRSVVEHHHRGTIGALVPREVILTAIERNRLLFTWKHADDPKWLAPHVAELSRRVAEACALEDRPFLAALVLALEDLGRVPRAAAGGGEPSFERIRRASDPFARY